MIIWIDIAILFYMDGENLRIRDTAAHASAPCGHQITDLHLVLKQVSCTGTVIPSVRLARIKMKRKSRRKAKPQNATPFAYRLSC